MEWERRVWKEMGLEEKEAAGWSCNYILSALFGKAVEKLFHNTAGVDKMGLRGAAP